MAATYIETKELIGTTVPATAKTIIRDSQWGIDSTLSGCIIQSVNITNSRTTDQTQDQKGAVVSELDYDQRWDAQIEVIGPSDETGKIEGYEVGDTSVSFAGRKWKIASVTFNGSFQDKKRYTISMYSYANFPG